MIDMETGESKTIAFNDEESIPHSISESAAMFAGLGALGAVMANSLMSKPLLHGPRTLAMATIGGGIFGYCLHTVSMRLRGSDQEMTRLAYRDLARRVKQVAKDRDQSGQQHGAVIPASSNHHHHPTPTTATDNHRSA